MLKQQTKHILGMKRKILIAAASLILAFGMASAQAPSGNRAPQGPPPQGYQSGDTRQSAQFARKRTDDMVRKYGLDQRQAKKLYRLNKRYGMPGGMPGKNGGPGMQQGAPGGMPPAMNGQQPSMEQRENMENRMREDMSRREKYEKKLSRILTPEQFRAYMNDQAQPRLDGRGR